MLDSLELEDQGFDFSVLSEFRARLVAGGAEQRLFEALLRHAKTRGWRHPRVVDSALTPRMCWPPSRA
jgi:hypothetical protein